MRIRTATWDELREEPTPPKYSKTEDTHCWCARPGGCDVRIAPGRAGRLCMICAAEKHPAHDPKDFT